MGEEGSETEFFNILLVFTQLQTPELSKKPTDEILDRSPELLDKLLDKAREKIKENQTTQQNSEDSNISNVLKNVPEVEQNTVVFKREDDKKYYNKTIRKGSIQKTMEIGDTVTSRRPAKNTSKVDTLIIRNKTN